jgi:hypothetical protein
MSDLNVLTQKVVALLKDDSSKIQPEDVQRAIQTSLTRYSAHRPDEKVVDVVGNGTHDYTLPTGWVQDFSSVISIEYPIGSVPAELLDDDDFEIYNTPTGRKLRLKNDAPPATASFRATFSVPRTDVTLPQQDEDALVILATSLCLEMLANAWVQSSDSTLGADSVNYRTKSQEAASRAAKLLKLYKEHVGLKEDDGVGPASAVSSHELNYPGGGDRLTHPRRLRRLR